MEFFVDLTNFLVSPETFVKKFFSSSLNHANSFSGTGFVGSSNAREDIRASLSNLLRKCVHRDNVKRIEIQIELANETERETEGRKKRSREETVSVRRRNGERRKGETLSKHGGVSGDESPAV